jgi:catechol 2,3-dioxygenase-like lactoylglutathione lyase family enzyme
MSLEIGGLRPLQPPAATRRPVESPGTTGTFERVDTAELSFPVYPPAEVLDEVGAAADRAEALAAANRELHFRVDDESGRVVVEVRDFDGNVIRTIPPSEALDVMAGAGI